MRTRAFISITVALLVVSSGCRREAESPSADDGIRARLQTLLATTVGRSDHVHGAAVHVDSSAIELDWDGAAGLADPDLGIAMTPAHPVRIASNTKTFVAAAVLRLWEDGDLDLDDSIGAHLPDELVNLLRNDGYDPRAIRIRHLLTHTSGLFDHSGPDRYGEEIVARPMHRWTPLEQVAAAVEWGDPHGPPGLYYTYCDTGYILLGSVLEQTTGTSIAAAVRRLVGFERLGLASTWWETFEPEPAGIVARAHQFLGDLDVTAFDPSFDLYGGGGLVSTVGDMARFTRALFTGGVFRQPETLKTMLTTVPGLKAVPVAAESALPPGAYRMGVWEVEVAGVTAFRHTGFWGTSATWVPELDLIVTATVNQNQARAELEDLTREAIVAVAQSFSEDQ